MLYKRYAQKDVKLKVGNWVDLLKSEDCRPLSGNSNSAFPVISRTELNFVDKKKAAAKTYHLNSSRTPRFRSQTIEITFLQSVLGKPC